MLCFADLIAALISASTHSTSITFNPHKALGRSKNKKRNLLPIIIYFTVTYLNWLREITRDVLHIFKGGIHFSTTVAPSFP